MPTRELAEQIDRVAHTFLTPLSLRCLCLTGGQSEWQQKKALHVQSFHLLVGTPGRFIDLINQKYIPLHRCSFVVLDEADRMISLGFEAQIRSLLHVVRPDRQLLLFSATFPPRIVRLALELMTAPVRVAIGRSGLANQHIQQEIVVVRVSVAIAPHQSFAQKLDWLKRNLAALELRGKVLLFVGTRQAAEELAVVLRGVTTAPVACIHGEKLQAERSAVIAQFRSGAVRVLIATDVAARGLDVTDIQTGGRRLCVRMQSSTSTCRTTSTSTSTASAAPAARLLTARREASPSRSSRTRRSNSLCSW